MVEAVAFACIQCKGVSVRRVEFTAEFKACLPLLRFSGLGHEPIDTAPIDDEPSGGAGVEQHLHIAHAATSAIALPSLAFLRYAAASSLADRAVYLRAFGICLQARGTPSNPAVVYRGDLARMRPLDRLADVVDRLVRDGEYGASRDAPFRFVASTHDPLGQRAAREGVGDLRIVAARKVRAVLLAEPPSYGDVCRVRLFTDTDRPRASVPIVSVEKARAP